ncbi:methanogenesis marker 17 protein [Methanosarcinales archaeon]|nr:MAG: methanogenesis marker 17 protein [Methanosarcinales archaeon]
MEVEVEVEGAEEFGRESYKKLCSEILRDIGVRTSIKYTKMYCNPRESVFIVSLKIGNVPKPVRVTDIVDFGKDKMHIRDEKHAPRLLSLLWAKYGDRVWQISRLEIGYDLSDEEIEKMKEFVVYDFKEDLAERIMDGLNRIIPEGARIRQPIKSENTITLIASENPITDEWKRKAIDIASDVDR